MIISLISVTFGCHEKEDVDYRKLDFEELFTHFLSANTDDIDRIKLILEDSVQKYPMHILTAHERFDTSENRIKIQFNLRKLYPNITFCFKYRNVYLIQIDQHSNIEIRSEQGYSEDSIFIIDNIDSIYNYLREFILNPEDLPHLPQKTYKEIELLDTTLVSKQRIHLFTKMFPDSSGKHTSWITLRNVINDLVKFYGKIRNDKAQDIWEKDFNMLNTEKQNAISELIPIRIWIYLNRNVERMPVPPPPPPKDIAN